jgi:hypothetical protein
MEISKTLNKITKGKRRQAKLIDYVISQDQILGNKVRFCGSWLLFREWIETNEARLLNANFCKKHLLCLTCAVRRVYKMTEAYMPKLESLVDEHPKLIPAMVTLTVKNGRDLGERIAHLKRTWSKMLGEKRKGASSSGRHLPVEWNKVFGSLRAMEVTIAKNGEWHPHFHVFVLLDDYIDQRKLSAEWQKWSGDSKIVGVTKCRNGIMAGFVEVVKYASEFSKLSVSETLHVHQTCQGHRLIDPQGCLRGIPEPDIDYDSIEGMTGPYRDYIAQWLAGDQRYSIHEVAEFLSDYHKELSERKKERKRIIYG